MSKVDIYVICTCVVRRSLSSLFSLCLIIITQPFNGHINTAEQRTIIIQQYGDWCTGRLWMNCYFDTARRGLQGEGSLPVNFLFNREVL